ncbi:MAG TPA: hypothetical protein VKU82_08050 [Planctomycetaceae bacterium]|nr:hypothetical protein [Planctomycetaceae bacterium]
MREQGHRAAGRFRRRMGVWAPLVFVCVAGCGYELYEQRLENTKILFAHMDLLNQHLQGAWEDGGTGISLRVPMQFTLLAPPAKTPAAPDKKAAPADGQEADESDEDETEEILDDRQPKYMNVFLPGLRGAFQAGLKIATETNTLVDGDGYLYVMTNHELAESLKRPKNSTANSFARWAMRSTSRSMNRPSRPKNSRPNRGPL